MVKVWIGDAQNSATMNVLRKLELMGVEYETEEATRNWLVENDVRCLPVFEIDGKLMAWNKASKKLKKGNVE